MMHYVRVYKKLLVLNAEMLTAYRGNLVNSIISSVVWGLLSVLSVLLLTTRVESLFGWSRTEIVLLTCVFNIFFGVFHMLFSRNFEYFSRIVHLGQLDSFLLKPIDAQFLLSVRYINYTSSIRIVFGIILTAYFLRRSAVTVNFFDMLFFFFLTMCGLMIIYSIWYLVTTLTIWFSRLSNIVEALFTLSSVTRYPPEMYREFSFFIFAFLLPLILVIATPTKFLLGRFDFLSAVGMVILAIIFFLASRRFWRYALRSYTSVSS